MRHVTGLICILALGVVPVVGCNSGGGGEGGLGGSAGAGGVGGEGGVGGTGGSGFLCQDDVCPCTELGIRAAIAAGGGPYTFSCGGPQTVVTEAEIVIDSDIVLDGGGDLVVDGGFEHRVFSVEEAVSAELRAIQFLRECGKQITEH